MIKNVYWIIYVKRERKREKKMWRKENEWRQKKFSVLILYMTFLNGTKCFNVHEIWWNNCTRALFLSHTHPSETSEGIHCYHSVNDVSDHIDSSHSVAPEWNKIEKIPTKLHVLTWNINMRNFDCISCALISSTLAHILCLLLLSRSEFGLEILFPLGILHIHNFLCLCEYVWNDFYVVTSKLRATAAAVYSIHIKNYAKRENTHMVLWQTHIRGE